MRLLGAGARETARNRGAPPVAAGRRALALTAALALAALLGACGPTGGPTPPVVRLFELAPEDALPDGGGDDAAAESASERGPGEPAAAGQLVRAGAPWRAPVGVDGFAAAPAGLSGRASGPAPILRLDDPFELTAESGAPASGAAAAGAPAGDLVEGLEVRLRASGGGRLRAVFLDEPVANVAAWLGEADELSWPLSSPLVADGEPRTYRLDSLLPLPRGDIRQLLLQPTDAAGAEFEVVSVRPLLRRERLLAIDEGLGWLGLGNVYRQALAVRSPATHSWETRLPADPWLDLAVGSPGAAPLVFTVRVEPRGGAPIVRRETVSEPDRWHELPVDLAAAAGRRARISLELDGGSPGQPGFWGTAAVRSRQPEPASIRPAADEPPRGVIVVWSDSLRRDHLAIYGHSRANAPNLERLAREGVVFEDCVAQGSWTKVSTVSLLTSLYPSRHGVVDFPDRLPDAAHTLAELYRDAGHATLSLSSILLTGRFSGLEQGFDELHESISFPDKGSSKTARAYVDRLLPWLERHRRDRFFVLLHVYDPHDPYKPEAPWDELYVDASRERRHAAETERTEATITDPLRRRFGMPNEQEILAAGLDPERYMAIERDWYDGSIRGMDEEIGRLVAGLERLGLADDTLIVFASDHGEEFLDHGRMFHGHSVYSELIDVPLILWAPGRLPAGELVAETVEIVDLMPTLLELSEIDPPAGLEGQSLVGLIRGDRQAARKRAADWRHRAAIAEKPYVVHPLAPPPRETESVALLLDGWKLIHNLRPEPGWPEFELYDRKSDPTDSRNLAAEKPGVVRRMAGLLAGWRAGADTEEAAGEAAEEMAEPGLDSEDLERLQSLGYLGDDS